jgi:hypothetical protein
MYIKQINYMPNYQNTVIYKIVCNDLSIKDLYVGHTTNFTRRKNQHKNYCINQKKLKVYEFINTNGGWSNWSMILIELFPCNDGNEARARERYYYEEMKGTLNFCVPNRTVKEYKLDNADKIKQYKLDNADKIKILRKQYRNEQDQVMIMCKCGWEYKLSNKANHLKSVTHRIIMNPPKNKNNQENENIQLILDI